MPLDLGYTGLFLSLTLYRHDALPEVIPGNGNRGVGGIFGIPPPGRKFFENTPPPWRFWVKPPFCFLNERKR